MRESTNSLVKACAAIARARRRRRRQRAIAYELSVLPDYILKDIGVCRHDIPRVAKAGRGANQLRHVWQGQSCG